MPRHILIPILLLSIIAAACPGRAAVDAGQETSVVHFRGDSSYPPYEYLDADGRPAGFNIDIVRAVADALDLDVQIDLGNWAEVRRQLESGEIDALLGMYNTPTRDDRVDFCIPNLMLSYAVFVREGSPITSLADIDGKSIVVQNGDLAHDFVVENDISSDLIVLTDWYSVLRTLAGGTGDCAIVTRLQGMRLIDDLGLENLRPVGKPIMQREYGFAVREGNTKLLATLNEGLSIVKTSGAYGRIYESWFGAYATPRPSFIAAVRDLAWFLAPLVLIAAAALAWSWSLRRQVEARTRERVQVEREKLELERHLVQAQKLEAMGTLAGGIAHDFNNILGAIIGYVELARESLSADSPARADLDEVTTAAKRATGLIRQILLFSRQQSQDRSPVDVRLIATEALRLLRAFVPTTIEFCTDIAAKGTVVMADPGQIHQVIMNLCTNAYHAMQDRGGTLDIRLHVDEKGDNLLLKISDTGIGMDSEVARRCMEPFFTTKDKGHGTGMGLSVVYGIVAELNGTIAIDSQPGRGTSVSVTLPCTTTVAPVAKTPPVKPQRGSERILFVDDEPMLTDLAAKLLTRLGYVVRTFTNSLAALDAVRADPEGFDVLITDQTMPGMTGGELVQEAKSIRPDLPIILCTGYSDVLDESQALEMGVGAFLMKPVDQPTLAEALERVLNRG